MITYIVDSIDQMFPLEVAPKIQNLPNPQSYESRHSEHAEPPYALIRRFVRIAHPSFSFFEVVQLIHDLFHHTLKLAHLHF